MHNLSFALMQKCALVLTLLALSACTSTSYSSSPMPPGADVPPPMTTSLRNYEDIEIPADLTVEESRSIRTASFRGGLHRTKTSLDVDSLRNFMIRSFESAGWTVAGEADYDQVMLAFVKPNKTCMVMIYRSAGGSFGSTYADFYITDDLEAARKASL